MKCAMWKMFILFAIPAALCGAARGADFTPCADAGAVPALQGSLCARQVVPASYDAGASDTVTLFVRRFPAPRKSRGSVWLVAGGPGESGASLYSMVGTLRRAFPDFDLIVPDHRGTGYSSKLCPDEEAAGGPGGMALAGAEWGTCFARLKAQPELAQRFSITTAAHDLQLLIGARKPRDRKSLDTKPVYLYGVSYGTQLVLRALQLGPLPVAGVILDSLVPPQTAPEWDLSRRSFSVDDVGRQVLAQCDAQASCRDRLGEPAATLYRRVLALAADNPALLAEVPGKNMKRFLGGLLDVPAARARIPYLIKELEQGRGDELKAVRALLEHSYAQLGEFAQSPPSIPLVGIISASENNLRPQLLAADLTREDEQLLFTSRLPELLASPTLPLYPRDRYFGKLPARLPPVLVFHGTLDPKTHYNGALSQVAALRQVGPVRMVAVAGAPHFILWSAPACFEQATRAFVAGRRTGAAPQSCGLPD